MSLYLKVFAVIIFIGSVCYYQGKCNAENAKHDVELIPPVSIAR